MTSAPRVAVWHGETYKSLFCYTDLGSNVSDYLVAVLGKLPHLLSLGFFMCKLDNFFVTLPHRVSLRVRWDNEGKRLGR